MSKGLIVTLVAVGALILIPVLMYVGANNREVGLRNRAAAQQRNLENIHDRVWKILQQQADVADAGKEGYLELYPKLMEGRYGNARGGALLSFVKEHNPTFDLKLYDRLSASIEAQRTDFAREQTKLLDIKREHDDMLQKLPDSLFVGGRPPLEVKIITSSRSRKALEEGKDDDVNLFQKKKK